MDWNAWLDEQRPQIQAICRGEGIETPTPLRTAPRTTAWDVCCAVEEVTGVPASVILGRRRSGKVCEARRLAVKLMWKLWPHATYEDIGRAFGVHHTSVMGMKRHSEAVGFKELLESARARL